jgi:hypothetical protein
MAYVRAVETSSGASAVQIVSSSRRGSRRIEHLGSADDDSELAVLRAAAAQRLAECQQVLDLGLADTGSGGAPLELVSSQASHLWDGLCWTTVCSGSVECSMVMRCCAIWCWPASSSRNKIDKWVLVETGVRAASYCTVRRPFIVSGRDQSST